MLSTLSDLFHEDSLFAFQGGSFHCSQLKHLWGQQGEVCIVIHSSWVICPPRQGIRSAHLPSGLVGQDKVKPGEVQGPLCLAVVQFMGLSEVRQVLMIHVDLKLLIGPLKEVPPLL